MPRRTVLTTATDAPTTTTTTTEPVFQQPLPTFTPGEQPDKVKNTKKPKKKEKGRKKVAKSPKKRAFTTSDIIKGQRGIPMKKNTTLRSLLRGVWWGRKPLLELLRTSVKLMDGQFLNKRTTLLSLMRNIPMAKKPLVDVIVNKIL